MAAILKACLDGIKRKLTPPKSIDRNIYEMKPSELQELGFGILPTDLDHALITLGNDVVIQEALGMHIFENFMAEKQVEWESWFTVHPWEVEHYMKMY